MRPVPIPLASVLLIAPLARAADDLAAARDGLRRAQEHLKRAQAQPKSTDKPKR